MLVVQDVLVVVLVAATCVQTLVVVVQMFAQVCALVVLLYAQDHAVVLVQLDVARVITHVWLFAMGVQDNVHQHAVDALVVVEDVRDVQVVAAVVVLVHVNHHVLLLVIQIVLLVVTVH